MILGALQDMVMDLVEAGHWHGDGDGDGKLDNDLYNSVRLRYNTS